MKQVYIIAILFTSFYTYGQGCSDAGVCSFHGGGKMKQSKTSHSLSLSNSAGLGDEKVFINANKIGYKYTESEFSIALDLGYSVASGEIGTFGNASDLNLSLGYNFTENFSFMIGNKIPLNDADQEEAGKALPMAYQSSLGTFDLLLGGVYQIDAYTITLAYQHPLTDNKNSYFQNSFPEAKEDKFASTNGFQRSGDLLLRFSRNYDFSAEYGLTLNTSILSIYHIQEDKYTELDGTEQSIANSDGLTLNLVAGLNYAIDDANFLDFRFGFPVKVRDIRPDGTTRGISAVLEYGIKF